MDNYNNNGQDLNFFKVGNHLGVQISDSLSWNAHIATTGKKARNALAFLRRNRTSCLLILNKPELPDTCQSCENPYPTNNIHMIEADKWHVASFIESYNK